MVVKLYPLLKVMYLKIHFFLKQKTKHKYVIKSLSKRVQLIKLDAEDLLEQKAEELLGTKNIDIEISETLGLQLVHNLINQIEGKLEIDINNGTEFKILFKQLKYKNRN